MSPLHVGPTLLDLATAMHPTVQTNGTDTSAGRQTVLEHIRSCGAHGATDDEGEAATGMRHQSYSARRRELATENPPRIIPAGRRPTSSGRTARVWTVAP